jgi:DNA-binding HxlR family transcriptional regulator
MAVDPNVPWDLIVQVKRSERKTEIVKSLGKEPACASELGDEMDIQTDSASNYLRDLKQMEPPVVRCITPNQPHHRLYALTSDGRTIIEHL